VTLEGRVAVVTGAASGIGLALCEAFAAEGMRLVLADLDQARLETAAARLAADTGADVLAVPTDVARWDDVESLARRSLGRFGAVHVLCNNAGVTSTGAVWEFSLAEWEWVLGVDLWGVIHGVRAFVPGMIERGEEAHVVNTASVGGLLAFPGIGIYSAAKFAVVGLSETLHHDLRERGAPVGVSVLCPGPTATPFRETSASLRPGGEAGRPLSPPAADVHWVPPAEVAARAVDAILRNRFWILSHPAYDDEIERRTRTMLGPGEAVAPALR
jgi:NAD(P)-dependent dehydrogenase (short-subunit alcohol dehydrogenase family)